MKYRQLLLGRAGQQQLRGSAEKRAVGSDWYETAQKAGKDPKTREGRDTFNREEGETDKPQKREE